MKIILLCLSFFSKQNAGGDSCIFSVALRPSWVGINPEVGNIYLETLLCVIFQQNATHGQCFLGLPVHAKEDLEKPLLSREYAVPAEIMFKTLFDPECPFFKDHLIATGSFGEWSSMLERRDFVLKSTEIDL